MTTRYLAIGTDALIGLVLLPFNVHHLGPAAYGLWMLTASMTTYFSVLDLGFGGSIVKFVAHYRAKRDARGLNEIASTLFVVFSIVGVVAYAVFVLVALNIGRLLHPHAGPGVDRPLADADHRRLRVARTFRSACSAASSTASSAST